MLILKQPLLHFLLLGGLLFLIFEFTARYDDDDTIVVDRAGLMTFMQFRSRAFDASRSGTLLDDMPPEGRQRLIDDFVREEVLYREALALGLDANDYIIRRRLVQKVEYLARGFETPTDIDPEAFYQENPDLYIVPASVTFTHVFVSYDNHPTQERAQRVAEALRRELVEKNVSFAGALTHGERFAFHKNYVDRSQEFVASHFGTAFSERLFALPVEQWAGPVESAYGLHLVLIRQRSVERAANFAEVAQDVRYDAEQAAIKEQTEQAIRKILDRYEVVVKP